MKNRFSLLKIRTSLAGAFSLLSVGILLSGAALSFGATCEGTAYFKAPDGWTSVYVAHQQKVTLLPTSSIDADGYYVVNLATINSSNWGSDQAKNSTFGFTSTDNIYWTSNYVDQNVYDGTGTLGDREMIKCPGAGRSLYVIQGAGAAPYFSNKKPSVKTFHVQLPSDKEWLASVPVISFDGAQTSQSLYVDANRCGWFQYTFLDVTPPDEAIIYLGDSPEDVFGMSGADDVTPIPMKQLFEENGVEEIFMTQDGVISATDPGEEDDNACSYGLAAVIYDTDPSLHPYFSVYKDNGNGNCSGGYEQINKANGDDNYYCTGTEAVVSDLSLINNNAAISACVGVHKGIVQEILKDNKPQLSTSANAKACFPDPTWFDKMFREEPNVNEMSCFNLPFTRTGFGMWEFDSDKYMSPGTNSYGGFYPLENASNALVTEAGGKHFTPAARNKHAADGPVPVNTKYSAIDPTENAPLVDLFCNGPGWTGGVDCEGKFASSKDPFVWNWSGQAWNNDNGKVQRNQHFCFESHSKFIYKKGQRFSFRGDDDIWVFIGGKLAVDLGGTHLASPAYVNLDVITDMNGTKLSEGETYPIDIFFCDRRTSMSNIRIQTNMYIKQSTGLDFTGKKDASGNTAYEICWTKSGSGTCADLAKGTSGAAEGTEERACGAEQLKAKNIELVYTITNRANEVVPNGNLTAGGVRFGGIDLTDPYNPKVNVDKITGLGPGSYRLVIAVKGEEKTKTYISFRIRGNLDVLTMDATYKVQKGDEASKYYASGAKWTFVGKALAGTRVPIYVSAPDDQGGIDLLSAANQTYTLKVGAGVTLYKNATAKEALKTPYNGTVDSSGVDTLWITLPLDALGENPYATATASVRTKTANINFYAPKLVFAEPTEFDSTGAPSKWKQPFANDPDKDADGEEYFHWVGSAVDLYLLALDPTQGDAICTVCSYLVISDLGSSSKVKVEVTPFRDGVATVVVQSAIPYEAPNSAEVVVGYIGNKSVKASHGNMHFYKPPVPYPLLVELFDTKGPTQNGFIIPEPYFSETTRYADGKADSIAIVYDRAIPEDSLPTFICLSYDEDNLSTINPKALGYSNQVRDTSRACSMTFDGEMIKKSYKKGSNILSFVADSSYSAAIKTLVNKDNKVYSYAKFMWKGKESRQSFDQLLADRMAPVIIGASVEAGSKSNVMSINLSEYAIVTGKVDSTEVFSYYLNSASQMTADQRFRNPTALNGPTLNTPANSYVISYVNTDANPAPHLGDYIRFRSDSWMWSDTVTYDAELDTLLPADVVKARADKHWNSPTNYNSTARMPSAWVMVQGASATDITCTGYGYPSKDKLHEGAIGGSDFIPLQYGLDDVQKDSKYANTVGCIVKPSMSSMIDKYYPDEDVDPSTVYYQYEADYFTNLGNFVAHDEKKIFCNDKTYFPSGDCRGDTQHYNLLITWNMISDKKRLVGTGAYIAKIKSFIKVGAYGKKAKQEETHVWGVRRVKK